MLHALKGLEAGGMGHGPFQRGHYMSGYSQDKYASLLAVVTTH